MNLKTLLLLSLSLGTFWTSFGQTRLNAGIGFQGIQLNAPGVVLGIEHEKFFTEDLSLPLRVDLGYFHASEYQAFTLELHKGFRKYFDNGLLLEQSIGVGAIVNRFSGSVWYTDPYDNTVAHGNQPVWGITPSVTLGLGYDLSANKDKTHLVWVRPKVFWNLVIRGLDRPYSAVQIGYTYNFNTK